MQWYVKCLDLVQRTKRGNECFSKTLERFLGSVQVFCMTLWGIVQECICELKGKRVYLVSPARGLLSPLFSSGQKWMNIMWATESLQSATKAAVSSFEVHITQVFTPNRVCMHCTVHTSPVHCGSVKVLRDNSSDRIGSELRRAFRYESKNIRVENRHRKRNQMLLLK